MELIGVYLAAATLLVVAGLTKALRPDDTARALGATFGSSAKRVRAGVRLLALGESALGVVALIWPRPVPAALVAASYLGFVVLLTVVRRAGGALSSCGCFGRPDTPVTVVHIVVDVCLCAAASTVAASGAHGSIVDVLATQPWRGAPLAAASLLAAALCVLVLDELSRLLAVRRVVGITHGGSPRPAEPSPSP
ncbi:MAG TPA: MauE/DoxX family redox-associated membrane protein [Acidimicrobiales bacterium]|nr:MauE/DoxX family redox-associated membrane protein [Acidimicrobiales bacterium]